MKAKLLELESLHFCVTADDCTYSNSMHGSAAYMLLALRSIFGTGEGLRSRPREGVTMTGWRSGSKRCKDSPSDPHP